MCETINQTITSVCNPRAAMDIHTNQSEVVEFEATQNHTTQKITNAVFPSPTSQHFVAAPSARASRTATTGEAANGKRVHGILCA